MSVALLTSSLGNPEHHLDCRVHCTEPEGANRQLYQRLLIRGNHIFQHCWRSFMCNVLVHVNLQGMLQISGPGMQTSSDRLEPIESGKFFNSAMYTSCNKVRHRYAVAADGLQAESLSAFEVHCVVRCFSCFGLRPKTIQCRNQWCQSFDPNSNTSTKDRHAANVARRQDNLTGREDSSGLLRVTPRPGRGSAGVCSGSGHWMARHAANELIAPVDLN